MGDCKAALEGIWNKLCLHDAITSQRSHCLVQSPCGLGFQHTSLEKIQKFRPQHFTVSLAIEKCINNSDYKEYALRLLLSTNLKISKKDKNSLRAYCENQKTFVVIFKGILIRILISRTEDYAKTMSRV